MNRVYVQEPDRIVILNARRRHGPDAILFWMLIAIDLGVVTGAIRWLT